MGSQSAGTGDAAGGGGGVYVAAGAAPVIIDCVIRANRAVDEDGTGTDYGIGGGLYVLNPAAGSQDLNEQVGIFDCLIEDNHADQFGGGVELEGVLANRNFVVQNCLIIHNEAGGQGGGVCCNDADLQFFNCTVAHNEADDATDPGGGFYILGGSDIDIKNSIVWSNGGSTDVYQFVVDGASLDVTYSCIQVDDLADYGTGSIDDDPLFVDTSIRNYRVEDGAGPDEIMSPCIDTGNTSNVVEDLYDVDRDGNTTELMPDRDYFPRALSSDIDMGAFENCPADINDDGIVDHDDMTIVMNDYACCCDGDCDGPGDCDDGAGTDCIGDVSGDGRVHNEDIALIFVNWGRCTFQPMPESLVDCLNQFPGEPVMALACFMLYADDFP